MAAMDLPLRIEIRSPHSDRVHARKAFGATDQNAASERRAPGLP
jgi:hypothetical protein